MEGLRFCDVLSVSDTGPYFVSYFIFFMPGTEAVTYSLSQGFLKHEITQ